MSIEEILDRIAVVLEKIEARYAGDVPAKEPLKTVLGKPETAAAKKKRLLKEKIDADAAADPLAADDDKSEVDPPTKDAVRDLLTKLTEEHGRDVIVALFQRLGVKNLKELPESDYAKAIKMGDDALENGPGVILDATDD